MACGVAAHCSNFRNMKQLVAKVMFSLACAIIMLHAFVPHHHDECCGVSECFFWSEHHHHHSDHHEDGDPFDMCELQHMLSHLVLSSRHEGELLADLIKAEVQQFLALPLLPCEVWTFVVPVNQISWPLLLVPTARVPFLGTLDPRGPPMC